MKENRLSWRKRHNVSYASFFAKQIQISAPFLRWAMTFCTRVLHAHPPRGLRPPFCFLRRKYFAQEGGSDFPKSQAEKEERKKQPVVGTSQRHTKKDVCVCVCITSRSETWKNGVDIRRGMIFRRLTCLLNQSALCGNPYQSLVLRY